MFSRGLKLLIATASCNKRFAREVNSSSESDIKALALGTLEIPAVNSGRGDGRTWFVSGFLGLRFRPPFAIKRDL